MVVSKIGDMLVRSAKRYEIANTIQPGEHSKGSGIDGPPHISARVNGNRNVVCLNRNGTKRNLNLNNWDNDWPDNWGFLGVRHSFDFFPGYSREVFCSV
jgi:hypothetical protein